MKDCVDNYNCYLNKREERQYPTYDGYLYSDGIYDDHIAQGECYRNNPIPIVEGFSGVTDFIFNNWVLILLILVLALAVYYYMNDRETISLKELSDDATDSIEQLIKNITG